MTSAIGIISKARHTILWAAIVLFLFSAIPSAAVSKGKITSYSADLVMIAPDGKKTGTSRLFITPQAYRMDGMPMGAGQQGMPEDMTILGLNDRNRQYMYNHDKKLVYESDLDEQQMMELLKSYENVDAEQILGKEKVNGYPCIKKRVTTTTAVMGMKITTSRTIWQSDRFDMPLRTLTEEGHLSELRNIVTKKPQAALFEPLSGYTPVNNMMAVMGMDFLGGQNPESGMDEGHGTAASRKDSSEPADGTFKMPDIKKEDIEKTIQNIGDKLKKFKFGN
jgi:hypothetical protein